MPSGNGSLRDRLSGAIIAIVLGYFLWLQAGDAWSHYWLLKDSQQGKAVVTKELWSGHDAVEYRYIVDQKEYTGRDARGYQGSRYIKVMPGEETTVYFSGSHPWLSRLNKPRIVVEGLPVILIVMILEAFVVVTIISPKSRWAFNFSGVKRKAAVG